MSTAPAYPASEEVHTGLDGNPFTLDALDFDPQCEHRNHNGDLYHHFGEATWYQTMDCLHCHKRSTGLVCDLWRRTAAEYAHLGINFTCPLCLASNPHSTLGYLKI